MDAATEPFRSFLSPLWPFYSTRRRRSLAGKIRGLAGGLARRRASTGMRPPGGTMVWIGKVNRRRTMVAINFSFQPGDPRAAKATLLGRLRASRRCAPGSSGGATVDPGANGAPPVPAGCAEARALPGEWIHDDWGFPEWDDAPQVRPPLHVNALARGGQGDYRALNGAAADAFLSAKGGV